MNIRKIAKRENGVTLIVLIITIIVLLILAGVSINMITGQEGILKKLEDTKTKNEIAKEQETIELAALAARVDTKEGIKVISKDNLKNELDKVISGQYSISENTKTDAIGEYFLVTYKESRRGYKVYVNKGMVVGENTTSGGGKNTNDENDPEEVTEENAVASATQNEETKYFSTLQGAINSIQTTGTVTLLKDGIEESVSIASNKTIEMNTNGRTLSSSSNSTITNKGTLTIVGTGRIENTDNFQYYAISNEGTLNANSGTIESAYSGINNSGTLNVNGSLISAQYIGIQNNENGQIVINSGRLQISNNGSNHSYGIFNSSSAEKAITMNGGEIYSECEANNTYSAYGISNTTNTTVTINDGEIKAYGNYSAVGIYTYEGNVIVKKGVLYGESKSYTGFGIYTFNPSKEEKSANIEISGGTIKGVCIGSSTAFGIALSGIEGSTATSTLKVTGKSTIQGISSAGFAYGIFNKNISKGTIVIHIDGTISGESESGEKAFGIFNGGAEKVTIVGTNDYPTKINATADQGEAWGISNNVGTLKLWNSCELYVPNTTVVSINSNFPEITSSKYGIVAGKDSIFEFYDGKVTGTSALTVIQGGTLTISSGTEVYKTTINSKQTAVIKLK